MRKVINFLLIFTMIFSLTSCSSSKPETAVSEFIDAAKEFDLIKMSSKINPSSINKDKITDLELAEEDSYGKYFLDYLKLNAKKITYEIKSSKIDNDKAVVTVYFKYVNGGPLLKATIGDVFSQTISMAFAGVEMSEEETSQMFISSMEKQKANIAESFAEKTIDIKCVKINDQWYIDEPSDDIIDVILSNFNTVSKEIDESFNSENNNEENLTVMEQAEKDNMTIIEMKTGEEIVLTTLNLKVNGAEEKQSISSAYGSPTAAKDGAKFVLINLELTNTTNKTFSFPPDLILVDDTGREFNSYSDVFFSIDNYIDYRDLAPSIKETGLLVYEIPTDSIGYFLVVGKSGTNELYKIIIR